MKHNIKKIVGLLQYAIKNLNAANSFLFLALLFGLIFALRTPLLWGADETTHFARAYQVSHGGIVSEKLKYPWGDYNFGGQIPKSAYSLIMYVNQDVTEDYQQTKYNTKRVDNSEEYSKYANKSMEGEKETYFFPNMAAYSPVAYMPTATGLAISEGLNINVGMSIRIARIFNLIFYIVLVFMALRALKGLNISWLFLAASLIPAALFSASMISADGVANAFAILLSALVVKAWIYKKKLSKLETLLLAMAAICMPLVKLPYIFLSLVTLVVPAKNIPFPRALFIKISIVTFAFIAFGVWALLTPEVANSIRLIGTGERWQSISVDQQKDFILSHPVSFIEAFFRTLLLRDNNLLDGFFGQFGFVFVTVPATAIVTSIVSIMLAIQLVEKKIDINKKRLTYVISLLFVSIGGVFGTLYLTFTNVGAPIIDGVQGRYFLPFAPLVFVVIAVLLPRYIDKVKAKDVQKTGTLITVLIFLGLSITTVKFFYVLFG